MSDNSTAPAALNEVSISSLFELLRLVQAGRAPRASLPAGPQQDLQEGIRRLITISMAKNARGARARAAWRKIAEGGLELLAALGEEQREPERG